MKRAVVIGGSLAGMSAAKVLSSAFDEVVVLDRDHFPTEVSARSGVPQSKHAHALLERGENELEKLFPGFASQMEAGGALRFDAGVGLATLRAPGWQDVGPNGHDSLWSSRDLLESTVRRLFLRGSNAQVREGAQVLGISASLGPKPRVTGVRFRVEGGSEEHIAADLIVDASGRNTHSDDWLKQLGIPAPTMQRVDAKAGYASRFYKAPAHEHRPRSMWWQGLWVEWQPPMMPRGAVIFPIEGDRWLVTAAGIGDDRPPTDEDGFVRFLDTLASPAVAQAVALAEPISAISGNRAMANVFRRYDTWQTPLLGFIALGDAACAFNPIYGQGMSCATASAGILGEVLAQTGPGDRLSPAFLKRQGKFLGSVWDLATGADFKWPTTEGPRPNIPAPIGKYIDVAFEQSHRNAALRRHVAPVFYLTGPFTRFFHPRYMAQVLAAAAKRSAGEKLFGRRLTTPYPPIPSGAGL
jgi:2-polyprenyl-6-methoxyphenol hydroxylase-like FAD-dependent oxidoreductase